MNGFVPVNATSISELLARISVYPVTEQLARINGKRWAYIAGVSTATAEEIALPHCIQLDEHTGMIVRGWSMLTTA